METRLLQRRFIFLKQQLRISQGLMVDRVGLGGGLVLLWRDHVDATLISMSTGHIDIWISNWNEG